MKIIDAEGRVTPRGTPGELLTRGYSVMRGYWDDPERTREAIDAGGWMHTGDLAVIDEEGYCNIVGRVKDMIIRGGENISPREIEEFLYRHPAVLDVAVVGVPDPKVRRGGLRLHPAACRHGGHRGGNQELLPRADRALQGAALRAVRRRISAHGQRQSAEISDSRAVCAPSSLSPRSGMRES